MEEEMKIFSVGDNDIAIYGRHKLSTNRQQRITYVNVHQNETTSIDAAFTMVDNFGGDFWRLRSKDEDRLISFWLEQTGKVYTFDPNRIFTEMGCEKTLQENGHCDLDGYLTVREFANRFLQLLIDSKGMIVAVHNNQGGDYSAHAYLPGKSLARDCAEINLGPGIDPHDFLLTTQIGVYQELADMGLNVVLQDNESATDDGSLSVYCGRHDIPYVNVEARFDHLAEQLAMLQLLRQVSN